MTSSRIFIASSDMAKPIADKLRNELYTEYCSAKLWDEIMKKKPGQSKIETLEQLKEEYDFVIILLTKDDVLAKDLGAKLKVRDDCVFEAGFFMSAIGRGRCFLVSSVGSSDLPSDLEGIIRFTFKEPEDINDPDSCENAVGNVSALIKDRVQRVRKEDATKAAAARPLSREDLLAREKKKPEGGHLLEDQVVVAAYQPRELDYASAKQVRKNIDTGIRYVYLIEGNIEAAEKIPKMLQLLLLAKDLNLGEEDLTQRRIELVRSNRGQILADLKDICDNDKLNIYFLPESLDVEYCIHNAADRDFATLYVKHRSEYIAWESGQEANRFWRDTTRKRGADDPAPRDAVFHGARNFDVKGEDFYKRLRREMKNNFPDFGEEVLRLCVEGPQE